MTFKDLLENWETEMKALKTTMPINCILTTAMYKTHNDDLCNFIKKNCEKDKKSEKNEKDEIYTVPADLIISYKKLKSKNERVKIACTLIPRMFLIHLICQYDALIGNLAKLVLVSIPQILNGSDKQITFKELVDFKDLEDARNHVISNVIEGLLRKSHEEQIKWFENQLKLQLHSDKELLGTFYEITERRNLFTHNGGIVNDSYIKNCSDLGCNVKVNIGDELKVNQEYFNIAVDCLFELGSKLIIIIWRKVDEKKDLKDTENALNTLAYNLIDEKNYKLALKMLTFGLSCFKGITAANKLMMEINLAQCYLWLNQEDKCKEELEKQDWTLCTSEYTLCRAVLEKDYDKAIDILKNDNPSITQNDLLEWPVFNDFRKQAIFQEYFFEKYSISIEDYFNSIYLVTEEKDKDKKAN